MISEDFEPLVLSAREVVALPADKTEGGDMSCHLLCLQQLQEEEEHDHSSKQTC